MIQRLIVHAPANALSLGQVSFNILRELYRRKVQVTFFPRQIELGAYKLDPGFGQWLERAVNTRYTKLDRKVPTFNIWHLLDSEKRLSDKQVTLSFHETDSPTEAEINIVNQQDHTLFTSSWTVDNFRTYGAQNVSFVPLGLDEDFAPLGRRLVADDITHWVLGGTKAEQRKNTEMVIKTWVKRYGGKIEHQLTLAVTNPFFKPEQMQGFYNAVFGGAPPANVNILPLLKTNAEMNTLYNSADICLAGLSGSEAWNIPAHTTTALGKWCCVLNATAHKDWATAENSILVEPTGVREVYDGVFFIRGAPVNQGNIFAITEERIVEAMVRAESKAKTLNTEGMKLANVTYKDTVDGILEKVE